MILVMMVEGGPAHSGSDSDDLYIFLGYQSDKYSLIPAINYERHGVNKSLPPEVKLSLG